MILTGSRAIWSGPSPMEYAELSQTALAFIEHAHTFHDHQFKHCHNFIVPKITTPTNPINAPISTPAQGIFTSSKKQTWDQKKLYFNHTYHPTPPPHPHQQSAYAPRPFRAVVSQNQFDQAGKYHAVATRAGYTPYQISGQGGKIVGQREGTHPLRKGYCKLDRLAKN